LEVGHGNKSTLNALTDEHGILAHRHLPGVRMSIGSLIRTASACLWIFSLVACTTPASIKSDAKLVATEQVDLGAQYAAMAKDGGKLFTLDPQTSSVRIYAFRGGRAARLGHNHVLSAPQFIGYFFLPESGVADAHFDLQFRLDALEIDNPAYRNNLGPAFESKVSPEAAAGTREHMLGADGLQAEQFPYVRIHALEIVGEAPKFAVHVQIELHGQARDMWLPLTVEGLPDRVTATGSFVLRQSDFGAQPYSVMNGLLSVKDEVVVEFQVLGR
jgi:hypothetical protein